jgi:hypothetical protein
MQAYFAAVERETLQVARASGVTWAQLDEALGTSRQAVWQRATTREWPHKPRSGPHPFLDEDEYATLRTAIDEVAVRRDQIAGKMFDMPRGKRGHRIYPRLPGNSK